MKYCSKCGKESIDESAICPQCGCAFESKKRNGYQTAAMVFMVLGTVIMALTLYLIPLAWCLPMTIIYFNRVKKNEPVGTGFKVCSLIFVSLLGGIFMLCDKE